MSGPNGIFRSFRDRGISNIHVGGCVHLKMQRKLEDSAMATYSIGDLSRREIFRMSAILGVTSVVSTKFAFAQAALPRTPARCVEGAVTKVSLASLNAADEAGFMAALGDIYEHAAWVTQETFARRPFGSLAALLTDDAAYRTSEQFAQDRRYWLDYMVDRPAPVSLSGRASASSRTFLRGHGRSNLMTKISPAAISSGRQ